MKSKPEKSMPTACRTRQRARILVIDDELGPRESIRMLLKNRFDVVLVESGEEGIEKVREGDIDFIILDLKMKKMNGIEALEKIKRIDPTVAVLVLTGYGTLQTAQKAIRLGACDYLSKPFDVNELLETIHKNLTLKKERDDKEKAINQFKELNENLQKQVASLKKLISSETIYRSFLHEICNPLTSVLGYVQLILLKLKSKEGFTKEDMKNTFRELRIIENELQRCRLMYRSFSSFMKIGPARAHPRPLGMILEETILILKPQIDNQGVRVEKKVDNRCAATLVPSAEIRQILLNLCINSIHAMRDGGTLSFSAELKPREVSICVTDTGCGMDDEIARRAFEPNFTTKGPHEGSGLGLSISKGIVARLGGRISLQSTKGSGTSVRVSIPLETAGAGTASTSASPPAAK